MKVAAVSYLNTKPFIAGLETEFNDAEIEIILQNPSDCAKYLLEKKVDLALIPVGSLTDFEHMDVIDGFCIGADNKVDSVFVFSHQPLEECTELVLDSQSRTSNLLAVILLKKFRNLNKLTISENRQVQNSNQNETAFVMIGDKAILAKNSFNYALDLAESWRIETGLPFVFAIWACLPGTLNDFTSNRIKNAFSKGIESIPIVAEKWAGSIGLEKKELLEYYKKYISYELSENKKQALEYYLEFVSEITGKKTAELDFI